MQQVSAQINLPDWRKLRQSAFLLDLKHKEVLYSVSDETIEAEYNGVGPNRWPVYVRDVCSYLLEDVLEAVLIHDIDFVVGGDRAKFHEANATLGENVRTIAKRKYRFWSPRRYFLLRLSRKLQEWTDDYGWEGWHKC